MTDQKLENVVFSVSFPEEGAEREEALTTLSWMMRCFLATIELSYEPKAIRREEAKAKCLAILEQVKPLVTEEEFEKVSYGIKSA